MSDFLRMALRCRHRYGTRAIPAHALKRLVKIYDHIVSAGLAWNVSLPPIVFQKKRGRLKRRTGHNLLLRLQNHRDDVLRFLHDPKIPFTNNEAERDLRMMKCKQKISGGFRTSVGAQQFARIRGFISTVKKQGWNILDSLRAALDDMAPLSG